MYDCFFGSPSSCLNDQLHGVECCKPVGKCPSHTAYTLVNQKWHIAEKYKSCFYPLLVSQLGFGFLLFEDKKKYIFF